MSFFCPVCQIGRLVAADDLETGEHIAWECDHCHVVIDGGADAPELYLGKGESNGA